MNPFLYHEINIKHYFKSEQNTRTLFNGMKCEKAQTH